MDTSWPLTRRGTGLLVAAGGSWILGRLFGVPELAMATVALLALILLAIAVTRLLSGRLELRRRVSPGHLHIEQRGTVEIGIRNVGRLPTAGLRVDDNAPSILVTTSRFATRPLGRGESVQLRYGLKARRRGLYHVGPATVELRDPFGIARRQALTGSRDEVVVYPRILPLSGGPPLAGHLSTGSDGPPRPGPSGDELANIREYVRGDDLRRVHWRLTAHRGRLMVRQEENRQRPEAIVVLDCSTERHVVTATASSYETMITGAASVLWMLRAKQFRVRLVDGPLSGPPPARSWQETMSQLSVSDATSMDTITMWRQLERGVAGEGSLVAVVPTPDAGLLRTMVRAGRTFGARVALLVDPPPAPRRWNFERQDAEAAAHALRTAGWYATVVRDEFSLPTDWEEMTTRSGGRQRRRQTQPVGEGA